MEYCINCGDKIDEHELCEICIENRYIKSVLTAKEYIKIHALECSKYNECKPECKFWGLCENKTISVNNINSAVYVAEKIKEGVFE